MPQFVYKDGEYQEVGPDSINLPVEQPYTQQIYTCTVQVPRTTGTTAYGAADALGGMIVIPNAVRPGMGGRLLRVSLINFTAGQAIAGTLYLFADSFTNTADNSGFAVSDGEFLTKFQGHIAIAAGDADGSSATNTTTTRVDHAFQCIGTSLYGQIEVSGTPTLAASNDDVWIQVAILQY